MLPDIMAVTEVMNLHMGILRVPTSCESSKPTKRRSSGKNLNLYNKFQKNESRPLPMEFDYSSNLYRAVGENYQLFIRLISNEVDRHVSFHYRSWQEVPGDVKMSILTTFHHYFDLAQYHNTEYWDGIKLGIQADCANRYKDRKTKLKKHFDKEGGYDNTTRAKQNLPKGMDPDEWVQVKEGGVSQHVEGWRDMHFKGSSGWYNQLAEQHWENITDELNKAKSTSGGDDTPVDEVEVLQRSLGQRRGHVRGVGRKVKSITQTCLHTCLQDDWILSYQRACGTSYVYDSFFQPYISKHETEIDRNLSELRTMAGDITVLYWQRTASYVQTRTMDIIKYIASQSPPPKPQPSQQPTRPHKPAPNQTRQTAGQQPPSPAASSSSSSASSNSGSDKIDNQSDAGKPHVPPVPAVMIAQKASTTLNQAMTTELQTTTEPERKQIEPAGPSSSNVNPSIEPKEIMMEEAGRVTRARLRKANSTQ
ncbi:hypothetical protein R6Q57_021819 [Mikania cordata]